MSIALVVAAVLMAYGFALRESWPILKRLYIPASVVAGLIGLAAVNVFGWHDAQRPQVVSDTVEHWKSWPGWLIAIVFAGMLLDRPADSPRESLRRAGREGLMVWIIVLGETAVGLTLTWMIITPLFDVPDAFGMLIETGFAGGHGTAAAMGEVFASPNVDWPQGRDLGLLVATFGLIYGLISGVVWINVGMRMGWVAKTTATKTFHPSVQNVDASPHSTKHIDPLLCQLIFLAVALGVGMTLQTLVSMIGSSADQWLGISGQVSDAADKELADRTRVSSVLNSFPLFIYTLFGGWIVRVGLTTIGLRSLIDARLIGRLTSIAMDVLIVAAIASLNVQAVSSRLGAVSILLAGGAIWTATCLLVISRWVLPSEHWFQLGLINYGMSTGTTATGFVLLRMIDPELESGAAEDYALAAPLSSPFVGGGMITIGLPLLVLGSFPIGIVAITVSLVVVALIFAGRHIAKASKQVASG